MRFLLSIFIFSILVSSCKPGNKSANENTYGGDVVLQQISQEIDNDPSNGDLLIERARLFNEREAYDQAIADATAALKIDSLNAPYYHVLADAQIDYFRSREAIKTMKKVLAIYPDRVPSLLKLAEFYYWLQQYDESISTINNVIFHDANNAEAYFMLGLNFRDLGQRKQAINSLQRAVELDADLTDAWLLLGDLHEMNSDPIAYRYYDNATKVDPDNIEALHAKAFYLQNHDRIDAALELYKEINVKSPKYTEAYLNTGLIYLAIDSVEKAKEHFNIVSGIDPSNGLSYYYRALIERTQGNTEEAKAYLRTSLNLAPDNGKALQLLRELSKEQ